MKPGRKEDARPSGSSKPAPPATGLVSVIVTNYNYAGFLEPAVASLARQTHGPIELIVVDDASSDGSLGVLERLRRRHRARFDRFEVIELTRNGGKLHALNRGLPAARGAVTVILDADDMLHPTYLERTTRCLAQERRRNPRVAFLYTDCRLVDRRGAALARGRSTPFDRQLLQSCSYIPTSATTVTTAFQSALPFDERIRVGGKHHMWRKVVEGGWEGWHLEEPLFDYRMHDRNLSGIGRKVLRDLDAASSSSRILSGYWPTAVERGAT